MEAEFEREVLDRLIKIEEKLDGYNNAKVKTYENEKAILRIQNDLEDVTTMAFPNSRRGNHHSGGRDFIHVNSIRRRNVRKEQRRLCLRIQF